MDIQIGLQTVGKNSKVFIIAEIGINHEGDLGRCLEMVHSCHEAGANSVKLQSADPDENYVKGHVSWELFKRAQLSKEATAEVFELTKKLGMEPMTTSPDLGTLNWVDELGVTSHKVSSGMLTNDYILKKTSEKKKPILISTGMSGVSEIDHAINICRPLIGEKLILFQCTSLYPTPNEYLNLNSIPWMQERYQLPVGFSDHSLGIDASILAVGLGAVVIEKHFTFDKKREGFDHKISLESMGFSELVKRIRATNIKNAKDVINSIDNAELMLGPYHKIQPPQMEEVAKNNLRCLVARRSIKKGELFTEINVGFKRPFASNRGLEPIYFEQIVGRKSNKDFNIDDPIKSDSLERG